MWIFAFLRNLQAIEKQGRRVECTKSEEIWKIC